jgi:hypothetical protein
MHTYQVVETEMSDTVNVFPKHAVFTSRRLTLIYRRQNFKIFTFLLIMYLYNPPIQNVYICRLKSYQNMY